MLIQLSAAACLIAITIVIQAVFLTAGIRIFRWSEENRPWHLAKRPTLITIVWIMFVIAPIVLDVTVWAAFYHLQDTLVTFEEALYFSTATFTTVGYGDVVLSNEWRLLATFEAVNGWIIFGWSSALIMAVVQRLYFRSEDMKVTPLTS